MHKPFRLVELVAIAGVVLGGGQASAQEAVDWTGFYAGVFGGYALDGNAASGTSTGPATFDLGGTMLSGSLSNSTGRTNGIFGGAAAGYNYQHNALVLGIEASAGLGSLGKSTSSNLAVSVTQAGNTADLKSTEDSVFDINWYTSLQGRVGIAHENWLFFLKGGVVIADASVASTSRVTLDDPAGVFGIGAIDLPGSSFHNEVLVGPAFGLGAEVMVAENVSLSAEYSYVGLPDVTAPPAGLFGGFLGLGGGPTTFPGGTHQLKAGVSYHF